MSFEILNSCSSGLPRSQLSIEFGAIHDRKPHPDPLLEASISKVWSERCATNSCLYNGSKFRYDGCQVLNVTNSGEPFQVRLLLGLTDYKTFVGTNLSADWRKFLIPADDDVPRCMHTASPLGNGAIVETTDSCILVLQRSCNVGEAGGGFVFPGGHSEPLEVGIQGHSDAIDNKELNERIADEMFHGIVREVCEETGVPASSLGEPVFIGISRRTENARPTAFFYIKCHLSSSEVVQHYQAATDAFESTKILCLSKDELDVHSTKMPGCHQGGAVLFRTLQST